MTFSDAELVRMWPRVPDQRCMFCQRRGVCTWTRDAYRLCDECLADARSEQAP